MVTSCQMPSFVCISILMNPPRSSDVAGDRIS